jgi:predicted RNA-binding Zn-ribbon protein involved in translation (DUF1610 family)
MCTTYKAHYQLIMGIFKDIDILEFTDTFKDDNSCKEYLADYKWVQGFVCPKCGCTRHYQSKNPYIVVTETATMLIPSPLVHCFTRVNSVFVKPS